MTKSSTCLPKKSNLLLVSLLVLEIFFATFLGVVKMSSKPERSSSDKQSYLFDVPTGVFFLRKTFFATLLGTDHAGSLAS